MAKRRKVPPLVKEGCLEMGEVHRLLTAHGKTEVLTFDLDRNVVEAAAAYLGSETSDTGYLYSGWAQSALPHRRVPNDASWHVVTDHVSLLVEPGKRHGMTEEPAYVGVPYGSRARLILIYLQSEALKNNSRDVELGKTLHAWLKKLEIPIGGKSMATVRDQAERISRCRMSFQIKSGNRTGLVNQSILDTAMFVDGDSEQGSLFLETARLSETFFAQLKRHPVPIEEKAIGQISNNSMAIDIYCWLAYRLWALEAPTPITWKALHIQFGRGFPNEAHFRWYFKKPFEMALAVYPDAIVEVNQKGLVLNPSKPPVAPKIIPFARKVKS